MPQCLLTYCKKGGFAIFQRTIALLEKRTLYADLSATLLLRHYSAKAIFSLTGANPKAYLLEKICDLIQTDPQFLVNALLKVPAGIRPDKYGVMDIYVVFSIFQKRCHEFGIVTSDQFDTVGPF